MRIFNFSLLLGLERERERAWDQRMEVTVNKETKIRGGEKYQSNWKEAKETTSQSISVNKNRCTCT